MTVILSFLSVFFSICNLLIEVDADKECNLGLVLEYLISCRMMEAAAAL